MRVLATRTRSVLKGPSTSWRPRTKSTFLFFWRIVLSWRNLFVRCNLRFSLFVNVGTNVPDLWSTQRYHRYDRICSQLKDCGPAEAVAIASTNVTDRECIECFGLTWQNLLNQPNCNNVSTCAAGERVATAANSSADLTCEVCPPGEYQATAGHRELGCTPVTVCMARDQWESTPPTSTSDRVCAPLTVCEPTVQFQTEGSTLTTDRSCARLTDCKAGLEWESVAANSTSDRRCTALTVCESWKEFESTAATPTSDRSCRPISNADGCPDDTCALPCVSFRFVPLRSASWSHVLRLGESSCTLTLRWIGNWMD